MFLVLKFGYYIFIYIFYLSSLYRTCTKKYELFMRSQLLWSGITISMLLGLFILGPRMLLVLWVYLFMPFSCILRLPYKEGCKRIWRNYLCEGTLRRICLKLCQSVTLKVVKDMKKIFHFVWKSVFSKWIYFFLYALEGPLMCILNSDFHLTILVCDWILILLMPCCYMLGRKRQLPSCTVFWD